MESPFDVLRIDSDVDEEEITQAYRQRVKEAHLDQGGTISEFHRVQTAYATLNAGDSVEDHDNERDDAIDHHHRDSSRVEYLNYAILDDYGWTLDDADLFGKAAAEDLDPVDYGTFLVQPHESLLEAAENRGFAWPYACRGGACANCAVRVVEGDVEMPANTILPPEMIERGIRLSCIGMPTTEKITIVYNIKHRPGLDELRLPPRPFEQAYATD